MTTETDSSVADAELVRRACLGDRDAYADLVRRWSARVLAVCHARVRRRDVAQELAQETLLRRPGQHPSLSQLTDNATFRTLTVLRVRLLLLNVRQPLLRHMVRLVVLHGPAADAMGDE